MEMYHRAQFKLLIAALVFMGVAPAAAAAPGAVRCGRLLDVESGRLLNDQVIVFDGSGTITEVGNAASTPLPKNILAVDLSSATCLPGLIDVHTHLTSDPGDTAYKELSISTPRAALIGARNARRTLLAGFTTVRNVGASGFADIALRDAINSGDVPGPRMLASGPPLSITGGHNDQNLLAPEYHYSMDGVADGVDAVISKVRTNIKYGADLIKIMATGGVMSQGDDPGSEQYSPEEMNAIVKTAHALGRKVAAHAHGRTGIRDAILAGVDSIEHGSYIDQGEIQMMKERGIYLVPTLYIERWLMENYKTLGLTENMIAKIMVVIPAARANVSRALSQGVKVAFGTDAGVYPHGLNASEFSILVRSGLTPLQAIQAATINAADLIGWSDKVGALKPGFYADLIAVEGDPMSDIRTLESLKFVMKGGEVIRNQFALH